MLFKFKFCSRPSSVWIILILVIWGFLLFKNPHRNNDVSIYATNQDHYQADPDEIEIEHEQISKTEKNKETVNAMSGQPEELAPCGEICSYKGKVVNNTGWYTQLRKEINCDNIMKRMAFKSDGQLMTPTKDLPDTLEDDFTMSGEIPIKVQFRLVKMDERAVVFTKAYVDEAIERVHKGEPVNTYRDGNCVQDALLKYKKDIDGSRSLVVGTIGPWLEALLLAYGAKTVTTSEYREIRVQAPQPKMDAYTPYEIGAQYVRKELKQFEFGASFSSIEHAGLGRYGDPINPYGDLEAMAQVWCMMKPGGLFALGVPGGPADKKDQLLWNAHRFYGTSRLPHLTANWELLNMTYCPNGHDFLILRKPI